MTTLFNVWNPTFLRPNVLQFDVTQADLHHIYAGDDFFVSSCLRALSIEEKFLSWTIGTSRQNYYSQYPDSEDWYDRWGLVWTITVTMSRKVSKPIFSILPYAANESDSTAEFSSDGKVVTQNVLLVAFCNELVGPKKSIKDVTANWSAQFGNSFPVQLEWHSYSENRHMVRGMIEEIGHPKHERKLSKLLSELKNLGLHTNFQEVLLNWA